MYKKISVLDLYVAFGRIQSTFLNERVVSVLHKGCFTDIMPLNVSQRWLKVNKTPTDATVCRYLFIAKLLYMFRVSQHPSSGVLKTVPAVSGTGHATCTATPLQRGLIGTSLCESTRINQSRSDHVGGE